MDVAVSQVGWKAAVTNNFMKVAVRRMLAPEVVCGASFDQPLEAVGEETVNYYGLNSQKAEVLNDRL